MQTAVGTPPVVTKTQTRLVQLILKQNSEFTLFCAVSSHVFLLAASQALSTHLFARAVVLRN